MSPIIELNNIWLRYHDALILENIHLKVEENDFLGIIGPNGGGKTTLLKIILGLIKPNTGTVKLFGKPPEMSRRYVGYVPQIRQFDTAFPITVKDIVQTGRLEDLLLEQKKRSLF